MSRGIRSATFALGFFQALATGFTPCDGSHTSVEEVSRTSINETVDGETKTEYPDRKGIGMAAGPCGVGAGPRHHALWEWDTAPVPELPRLKNVLRTVFRRPAARGSDARVDGVAIRCSGIRGLMTSDAERSVADIEGLRCDKDDPLSMSRATLA